jgi:hypothetical protein
VLRGEKVVKRGPGVPAVARCDRRRRALFEPGDGLTARGAPIMLRAV